MTQTTVQVVWNSSGCGRCGGTGSYSVAVQTGGWNHRVCYDCRGVGIKMSPVTQKNRMAFRAWQKESKPTLAQAIAELETGRFGRAYKIVKKTA